jgi:acyl-coenzyme A synthetase/AMP-(fatty) acid ligase
MSSFAKTVLSPEQRARLAADPQVGGGNLLQVAIAANPHPEVPFIHSVRPLINTDGKEQHDFSLLQLDDLVQSWSVWYLAQRVQPRDRVAIYLEDSFAYWMHFYALAQIGAIAVLINSNASPEIAQSLLTQTSPVGLYTDRARLTALDADGRESEDLHWTQVAEKLRAPAGTRLPDSARFRHATEDPVTILHSSGTTGRPKPTIHTHRSIVSGPQFRLVDHEETPGALTMTGLPQSHLGCIAYTTYAVLAGAPTIAAFDRDGAELASTVAQYRPTAVMSFPHAYSELAAVEVPPGTLDSVNVWVSIGDAVHEAHIKNILARRNAGLPPAAFFDRLGTTELGWGVLLKVRTLATERNDRCAGKPVGVAEVAVLRNDGTVAAPLEVGLLAAKGPAITPGYWNNSDLTYRSKLSGYWLTGDNAYRDDHGDHFLVDRAVDAIETETGTAYSVIMEEVLLCDVPGVADCAVIAGKDGDRTVPVAVVMTREEVIEPEKLLTRANKVLQPAGHPKLGVLEIVKPGKDFPVGVTGKVLKRQLRKKYSALSDYVQDADGKTLAFVDFS